MAATKVVLGGLPQYQQLTAKCTNHFSTTSKQHHNCTQDKHLATICRQTSDSQACRKADTDSCWRHF